MHKKLIAKSLVKCQEEANFEILEGFLTELLKFDVTITAILESENNNKLGDAKLNRVDLLAEDAKKNIYIIEVQYSHELDYFYRMLFATSNSTVEFVKEGYDYSKIRKVYSINLLYFQLGQGDDYIYHGKNDFVGIHTGDVLQLSNAQRA